MKEILLGNAGNSLPTNYYLLGGKLAAFLFYDTNAFFSHTKELIFHHTRERERERGRNKERERSRQWQHHLSSSRTSGLGQSRLLLLCRYMQQRSGLPGIPGQPSRLCIIPRFELFLSLSLSPLFLS